LHYGKFNITAKVAKAPSVNSFKNRLDKHWSDMDIMLVKSGNAEVWDAGVLTA